MRRALLTSEKTGLPNKRAFDERKAASFVAMTDLDGLKALNDRFGYSAGDVLINRFAEILVSTGLDAYHDKGDEFICKGDSFRDLSAKLSQAQHVRRDQPFVVSSLARGSSSHGERGRLLLWNRRQHRGSGSVLEESERVEEDFATKIRH